MRIASIGAARRNLARDGETSWAEAYEANAEIQSGGNFIRIDRHGDIYRIFINILGAFQR
jgi:hypothetical protein